MRRREVLRIAVFIAHQEAEVTVAGLVDKMIAPLVEDVQRLKELSEQTKMRALDAADPAREMGMSAANPRAETQPQAK